MDALSPFHERLPAVLELNPYTRCTVQLYDTPSAFALVAPLAAAVRAHMREVDVFGLITRSRCWWERVSKRFRGLAWPATSITTEGARVPRHAG